jgi:hypothetical protein
MDAEEAQDALHAAPLGVLSGLATLHPLVISPIPLRIQSTLLRAGVAVEAHARRGRWSELASALPATDQFLPRRCLVGVSHQRPS